MVTGDPSRAGSELGSMRIRGTGATFWTVTAVPADAVPPSLSLTVTVTPSVPLRGYWWESWKVSTPGARRRVSSAEPSPQWTVTVWPSLVPGSAKVPARSSQPFSRTRAGCGVRVRFDGATLATVAVSVPVPVTPNRSVTATLTLYVP